VLARHCKELLGDGPSLDELIPAVSTLGGRLSRTLGAALARLSGNEAPRVMVGMPMDGNLASIDADIDTLASHSQLAAGPEGRPMLVTLTAAPVLQLVDRAFGGRGDAPEDLPDEFPLSADLLIAQIEVAIGQALAAAFDPSGALQVRPVKRDTSLRQLAPFPTSEDTIQLSLDIEEEGFAPWSVLVAFPQSTLAALLAGARHPRKPAEPGPPASPAAEPYGSMPVTVSAVLVDMAVGFAQLADLKPGDVLPVAVARNVPVTVDGRTIGSGTIGDVDDRVAVQLHHAF